MPAVMGQKSKIIYCHCDTASHLSSLAHLADFSYHTVILIFVDYC